MDREFYRAIYKNSVGYFGTLFTKEGESPKEKYFNVSEAGLDAFFTTCEAATAKGWNCYFTPAVLTKNARKKQWFKESNVVWVDHDTPGDLVEPSIPPTYVVETSPGKHHYYWLTDKPLTMIQTEMANKALAMEMHGDMGCWDGTRLLRVPDTGHFKGGAPYTSKIVERNPVFYTLDAFPLPWGPPIPGLVQRFV